MHIVQAIRIQILEEKRGDVQIIFLYTILRKDLNQSIIGVGCAAHIIHNDIQTDADLLPVDVENIVVKIYTYFLIYIVRVKMLKEFCETAEVEYQKILGYSKTHFENVWSFKILLSITVQMS